MQFGWGGVTLLSVVLAAGTWAAMLVFTWLTLLGVEKARFKWLERCEAAGIPAGPIHTVPEAHADPHVKARGMVQELPHPTLGRVKALGNPVKLSATPPRLRSAAPALGADTDTILRELGYVDADIAALRERRVV